MLFNRDLISNEKEEENNGKDNKELTEQDYIQINEEISKALFEMKNEKENENDSNDSEENEKELDNFDKDFFSESSNSVSMDNSDLSEKSIKSANVETNPHNYNLLLENNGKNRINPNTKNSQLNTNKNKKNFDFNNKNSSNSSFEKINSKINKNYNKNNSFKSMKNERKKDGFNIYNGENLNSSFHSTSFSNYNNSLKNNYYFNNNSLYLNSNNNNMKIGKNNKQNFSNNSPNNIINNFINNNNNNINNINLQEKFPSFMNNNNINLNFINNNINNEYFLQNNNLNKNGILNNNILNNMNIVNLNNINNINSNSGIKIGIINPNFNISMVNPNNNINNLNNNNFNCSLSEGNIRYINKENVDSPKNIIHIENIIKGKDKRTTLIIRNIPNRYTITLLLNEINTNYYRKYDVVYLPQDYINNSNLGFGFINFLDHMYLIMFYEEFVGKKWNCFNSNKRCQLAYSKCQGKNELTKYIHKKLGISSHYNNNENLKRSFYINNDDKYPKPLIEIPIKYYKSFISFYPYSLYHIKDDKVLVVDKYYNF